MTDPVLVVPLFRTFSDSARAASLEARRKKKQGSLDALEADSNPYEGCKPCD